MGKDMTFDWEYGDAIMETINHVIDGFDEMVEYFIVNVLRNPNDFENSILKVAIEYQRYETLKLLIKLGCNREHEDENGDTPLCNACDMDDYEAVNILVHAGVNINHKNKEGRGALHYAAIKQNKKIIDILVSKGADVNVRDLDGNTPLYYSVFMDTFCKSVFEYLVSRGAEVDIKNNNNESVRDLIFRNNHVMIYQKYF